MSPLQHLQATRLTRISTILLLALTFLATAMTTPSTAAATDETPNLARRQEMSSGSSCDGSEGQWNCMTTSFQRCGSGRWSEVQQCALGTHCSPSGLTYQFHVDFADGYLGAAPPTTSRAYIGSASADWLLLCGLAIALSWS